MFGYTTVNKPEMKFKEYDLYHSYYCGLCSVLKKKFGLTGEFTLSYDGAFLCSLLCDLYDAQDEISERRCAVHPGVKHVIRTNVITDYAADMNALMAMFKCQDDWHDDKKISGRILSGLLNGKTKSLRDKYADKIVVITKAIDDMNEIEKSGKPDPEGMAFLFGKCMSEVYAYKNDEWEKYLRVFGDRLGRVVYLMDAYEDVYSDMKKGRYNPYSDVYERPDFEGLAREMITVHLEEACVAFEKLPLIENVDFLRNILYSGIWIRFNIAAGKRAGVSNTANAENPATAANVENSADASSPAETVEDNKEEGGKS